MLRRVNHCAAKSWRAIIELANMTRLTHVEHADTHQFSLFSLLQCDYGCCQIHVIFRGVVAFGRAGPIFYPVSKQLVSRGSVYLFIWFCHAAALNENEPWEKRQRERKKKSKAIENISHPITALINSAICARQKRWVSVRRCDGGGCGGEMRKHGATGSYSITAFCKKTKSPLRRLPGVPPRINQEAEVAAVSRLVC